MSWWWSALAFTLLALNACGDPGSALAVERAGTPSRRDAAHDRVILRPGDSLLDSSSAMRLDGSPRSCIPRELRGAVRRVLASDGWRVAREAWRGGEELGANAPPWLDRLGPSDSLRRWMVRPPVDMDLGIGPIELAHEGREVPELAGGLGLDAAAERQLAWYDEVGEHCFWWNKRLGVLNAFGQRPPGDLDFVYRLPVDSSLGRWETALSGRAADDLTTLVQAVTVADQHRPSLHLAAPSSVAIDVDELNVDRLDLAVAVVDVGFALDDGRLTQRGGQSDGITFAVDVVHGGSVERIWSRHVLPGKSFAEATVDLSRFTGEAVGLRLVMEGGADDDTSFDYGLWSGLRGRGASARAPWRPHVVLIDIDTLRADRLGCYGYDRPTSPRIDAWAAREATVYTDATSTNNWTLPATISMLTGLADSQHGVVDFPEVLADWMEPIAARLRAEGYETSGSSDGAFVGPHFGFASGFDVFRFRQKRTGIARCPDWQAELDRLRERGSDRPQFLFLHTYEVHSPYRLDERMAGVEYDGPLGDVVDEEDVAALTQPTSADRAYLDRLYDSGVRRADDVAGAFLEGLAEVFGEERYMVVITSDHGEELLDRGGVGHGHSLHRELVRVPLIIRFPDGQSVRRSSQAASLLDIVPTVLSAAGLDIPRHLPGRSLEETWRGPRLRVAQHKASGYAVSWGAHKLLMDSIGAPLDAPSVRELYRVDDDPWESTNLVDASPNLAEELIGFLADYLRTYPVLDAGPTAGTPPIDAAVVEELNALGYLR